MDRAPAHHPRQQLVRKDAILYESDIHGKAPLNVATLQRCLAPVAVSCGHHLAQHLSSRALYVIQRQLFAAEPDLEGDHALENRSEVVEVGGPKGIVRYSALLCPDSLDGPPEVAFG